MKKNNKYNSLSLSELQGLLSRRLQVQGARAGSQRAKLIEIEFLEGIRAVSPLPAELIDHAWQGQSVLWYSTKDEPEGSEWTWKNEEEKSVKEADVEALKESSNYRYAPLEIGDLVSGPFGSEYIVIDITQRKFVLQHHGINNTIIKVDKKLVLNSVWLVFRSGKWLPVYDLWLSQ